MKNQQKGEGKTQGEEAEPAKGRNATSQTNSINFENSRKGRPLIPQMYRCSMRESLPHFYIYKVIIKQTAK